MTSLVFVLVLMYVVVTVVVLMVVLMALVLMNVLVDVLMVVAVVVIMVVVVAVAVVVVVVGRMTGLHSVARSGRHRYLTVATDENLDEIAIVLVHLAMSVASDLQKRTVAGEQIFLAFATSQAMVDRPVLHVQR